MNTFGKVIKIGNRITEVEPDGRGNLFFLELASLYFSPKRIFIVDGVPAGKTRGNHAHRTGRQFLICIKGMIEVYIDNGNEKKTVSLLPGEALFNDKLEWGIQKYYDDATLLSICSNEYNPNDYITDYQEFLEIVKK